MKRTGLALFCLLVGISTSAQTAKQHVNLGMSINEFATKFDVSRTDSPEALTANAAAQEAMDGKRVAIQMNIEGRKTKFFFDNRTLCAIEITAGNTFAHELQALTDQLGTSQMSDVDLAIWDRRDGTRFTLTSRDGTGVLLITPTPSEIRI